MNRIRRKEKILKRIKAVSVQSIIIGSLIIGVIAIAGLSALWPSVEKAKIYIIAETLDEHDAYIVSQLEYDYSKILSSQTIGDGDEDYLDELIDIGQVSNIPYFIFQKPEDLIWEIRAVFINGSPKFYFYFDSTNNEDLELLLKGREHRGFL